MGEPAKPRKRCSFRSFLYRCEQRNGRWSIGHNSKNNGWRPELGTRGKRYKSRSLRSLLHGYKYGNRSRRLWRYSQNNRVRAYADTNADSYCDTHTDTGRDHSERFRAQGAWGAHGGSLLDWGDVGQRRHLPRWQSDRHCTEQRHVYRFYWCSRGQHPLHV
jgi:hypothetical protein